MSAVPSTPRAKLPAEPATPIPSRVGATVQASPHYSTTRRHSLYGTEDRIILDPGSRIWKVGFSGEGRPRDVILVAGQNGSGTSLWSLSRPIGKSEREEEERMLEARVQEQLRSLFHESLLTDPKSRKVIIVEQPLLPLYVKDMIAHILFSNLQVPSISFASSHLLSLLAVGRITGLVLDCGYLESTALPIFASRPLYPHLRTTPLAGSRLTSHLRALLLMFGTYMPPLSSLGGAANIPAASRSMRVPEEVLTDTVMEEIKTRCCFVGAALKLGTHGRARSPTFTGDSSPDFELDIPFSDTSVAESDVSHASASMDVDGMSAASMPSGMSSISVHAGRHAQHGEGHLQALAAMYSRHSVATDLTLPVTPPPTAQTGIGRGMLVIPGWIRERGAEVLFEGGDVDEGSVAEVILDSLLKVPVDLRKTLACSILVVGGTPMLPGFVSRLHAELVHALTQPPTSSSSRPMPHSPQKRQPPPYDPYAPLRPLAQHIAILNNPSPSAPCGVAMSTRASAHAGKAPAFAPAALPWVGGSLAGALKIGGEEIAREKWDESVAVGEDDMPPDGSLEVITEGAPRRTTHILPDWTRTPLSPGAPPAPRPAPIAHAGQQAAVGA